MNPKLIIYGRVLSSAALTAEAALAAFRGLDDSAQDLLQSGERAEDSRALRWPNPPLQQHGVC